MQIKALDLRTGEITFLAKVPFADSQSVSFLFHPQRHSLLLATYDQPCIWELPLLRTSRLAPAGPLRVVVGDREEEGCSAGRGGEARFGTNLGLGCVAGDGAVVISDFRNGRLWLLQPENGTVSELLCKGGDGLERFLPGEVALLPDGRVVVDDLGTRSLLVVAIPGVVPPQPPRLLLCSARHLADHPVASLLLSEDMADVRVEADGGAESFPAHSPVLGAACEFFKRALGSGMAEGRTRTVRLEGHGPAAVKALLSWLYRGWAEVESSDLPAVMAVAQQLASRGSCRSCARGTRGRGWARATRSGGFCTGRATGRCGRTCWTTWRGTCWTSGGSSPRHSRWGRARGSLGQFFITTVKEVCLDGCPSTIIF
jgi:hypothetical protein